MTSAMRHAMLLALAGSLPACPLHAQSASRPASSYEVVRSRVVVEHPGGMPAFCQAGNGDLLLAYATNWQPINKELVGSVEYKGLLQVQGELEAFDKPPFTVQENGETKQVETKIDLLHLVLELGKKGMNFQRYKGLGEMNPDQLWETTMDPAKRTLLQVRVDDVVAADQIFTILMGDQVPPRRKFIEDHALEVVNLDI